MKKILVFLLVTVMMLSFAMPTFAEGDEVAAVKTAIDAVDTALNNGSDFEALKDAMAGFGGLLDAFNEFGEAELTELAALWGEADAEAAFNKVFMVWYNANIVRKFGGVYNGYTSDSNVETAKEFVDFYNDVFNDPDEELKGLIRSFFADADAEMNMFP